MDYSIISNAINLSVSLCLPILIGVIVGALASSILRTVTQIDDKSISFIGRTCGFLLVLFVYGKTLVNRTGEFAIRIWSGTEFFH